MMLLLAAAALVAAPAIVRTAPAPTPTPAPAPAAAAAKFSLDTPIETLMADAGAKAVVTANLPELAAHPMYEQFKAMSLNALAPMAPDKLTPDVLKKVGTELSAVK